MGTLEKIFGIYINSLWEESQRLIRIKGLKLVLEILKGWRLVTLTYFYAMVAIILFSASVFSALIYNIFAYNQSHQINLDLFNIVTGSIGIFSFLFLIWCLNEKRWLSAFNVEQQIVRLSNTNKDRNFPKNELDESEVVHIIEKVLDKKMDVLLEELMDKKIKSFQQKASENVSEENRYRHTFGTTCIKPQ